MRPLVSNRCLWVSPGSAYRSSNLWRFIGIHLFGMLFATSDYSPCVICLIITTNNVSPDVLFLRTAAIYGWTRFAIACVLFANIVCSPFFPLFDTDKYHSQVVISTSISGMALYLKDFECAWFFKLAVESMSYVDLLTKMQPRARRYRL